MSTSKALRYDSCVTRRSHSFTCHPQTNHTCLYSPAADSFWPVILIAIARHTNIFEPFVRRSVYILKPNKTTTKLNRSRRGGGGAKTVFCKRRNLKLVLSYLHPKYSYTVSKTHEGGGDNKLAMLCRQRPPAVDLIDCSTSTSAASCENCIALFTNGYTSAARHGLTEWIIARRSQM